MSIDDSLLLDPDVLRHAEYDPVKAREYYLRTRKLKGRPRGSAPERSPAPRAPSKVKSATSQHAAARARRAKLKVEKEKLEKRLARLKEVLREIVADAKKQSDRKAKETSKDKADRNADQKSRKPLTASQKREKAKKAREKYEKEKPSSLSGDIEVLREQIAEVRAKIQEAMSDNAASDRKAARRKT